MEGVPRQPKHMQSSGAMMGVFMNSPVAADLENRLPACLPAGECLTHDLGNRGVVLFVGFQPMSYLRTLNRQGSTGGADHLMESLPAGESLGHDVDEQV